MGLLFSNTKAAIEGLFQSIHFHRTPKSGVLALSPAGYVQASQPCGTRIGIPLTPISVARRMG